VEQRLHLLVEDDGVGIAEAEMATLLERGIGVSNVNERLKVLFAPITGCGSIASQGKGRASNRSSRATNPPGGGILIEEHRLNKLEESPSVWSVNGLPDTLALRTRRAYDRMSRVYGLSSSLLHSRAHQHAVNCSGIRDGMRILEVATGSGEMFRASCARTATGRHWVSIFLPIWRP